MTGATAAALGGLERPRPRLGRRAATAAVALVWLLGFLLLRGRDVLPLGETQTTPFHERLNRANSDIAQGRNDRFIFTHLINHLQLWTTHLVDLLQQLISQPGFGRQAPVFGWLGVIAVGALVVGLTAGARTTALFVVGFVFLGLQGLWQESMDTLALTIAAVLIAVALGVPLGIWAGMDRRVARVVTPVLDVMQTLPSFVYLSPLVLLFLIGNASSTIATLIYAIPPVIRVTAHAIRSVSPSAVEASDSLGATTWQTLLKVRLPLALRTVVMGINQTIMAALAMVTIAALISAPGLGQTVMGALQTLDVGTAFNAGLAIVILAIVLDRCTMAAADRLGAVREPRFALPVRRLGTGLAVAATLVAVYLSYTYWWANTFPTRHLIGPSIVSGASRTSGWVQDTFAPATRLAKNLLTTALLNPLQALFTESPFWLVIAVFTVLGYLVGGATAAGVSGACLGAVAAMGLWQDTMDTLAMTLVAGLLTMVVAVALGTWMGRSSRADRLTRPVLDAGQVMPAFVYLVPFLVLFDASRFTAIVCACVYAIPVAAKVTADGVRGVPENTVEAARSAGANTWQVITQVQLPLAARSLALATNQGLIYVLAMVVVGGMVGAGGLGYQVYNGFSQDRFFGKGLAAGLAIALLGVFLDRISQAIASHVDPSTRTR